jgi:hypothetical protein
MYPATGDAVFTSLGHIDRGIEGATSSDVSKVSIQSHSSRKPSASLSYIYFSFHSTLEHLRQLDSLHSPGEVHKT